MPNDLLACIRAAPLTIANELQESANVVPDTPPMKHQERKAEGDDHRPRTDAEDATWEIERDGNRHREPYEERDEDQRLTKGKLRAAPSNQLTLPWLKMVQLRKSIEQATAAGSRILAICGRALLLLEQHLGKGISGFFSDHATLAG